MGGGSRAVGGSLHGEVQCIMGNGHMRTPLEQNDRHTHVTILPSHCRGITQIHRSPSRLRPFLKADSHLH